MRELMKDLKELIKYDYKILNSNDTISKVFPILDKMEEMGDAILVKEDGEIIGVIREKDLIRGSILTNPHETKIKNFTIKTGTLSSDDLTLENITKRFIEDSTPFVIVKLNNKVGVIHINDFLSTIKDEMRKLKARDVMNADVITINSHETSAKALSLMRTHGVDRLVVVDNSHKVVGVITGKDIIDRIIAPRKRARMGDAKGEKEKTLSIMVESIMSSPPVTAEKLDSIADIIDQMIEHKISSIVIVSQDYTPEGIVTKKDILEHLVLSKTISDLKVELITRDVELDDFDREEIVRDLQNFMRKFGDFLGESVIFVYIKKHKEIFRSLPLIHVRLKLTSEKGTFFASGESWGVEYAIHATLKKLEREILKEKEILHDSKMVKRFYEEVFEF